MNRWSALMLTMAMATACAASQSSLVMHRQMAGEAGEDGWYLARSTKGGFSVHLPAQFNDFSIPASRQDNGHLAELDVVGTKIQDVGKFTATCIRYLDQAPGKDELLAPFKRMGARRSRTRRAKACRCIRRMARRRCMRCRGARACWWWRRTTRTW